MRIKNVFDSNGEFNLDLLNEKNKIYILSSDVNARKILYLLLQNKVRVLGFVEKDGQNEKQIYGLYVYSLKEIDEKDSVYVVDKEQWYAFSSLVDKAKVYCIDSKYFNGNEFVFEESGQIKKCNAALMLTMILARAQKKQAVFLVHSTQYAFWANLVNVLKNTLCNVLIIAVDAEIENIFELAYFDIDKTIVFVSIFEHKSITEILLEIGLKQTEHFVYIYNSFSGHITDRYYGFDWILGNTFRQEREYPGFYIHGEFSDMQKKIVLLGNSVTDPLFYPQKSWPDVLYENFNKNRFDMIIYNGAVTDYSSTNEVIKLYRDVLLLKPDIVVSFSGVIDFRQYVKDYPYINLNLMKTSEKWERENAKEVIHGMRDKRSAYERWINNEKIMYQICLINDISFYGVLQPWIGSECTDPCEKLQMWSDNYWQISFPQFDQFIENAREFKEKIRLDIEENDWLYDFTNIFQKIDDSEIYFDSIHVNEHGNSIIAENFYNILNL